MRVPVVRRVKEESSKYPQLRITYSHTSTISPHWRLPCLFPPQTPTKLHFHDKNNLFTVKLLPHPSPHQLIRLLSKCAMYLFSLSTHYPFISAVISLLHPLLHLCVASESSALVHLHIVVNDGNLHHLNRAHSLPKTLLLSTPN